MASEKMVEALNNQINAELYSAYLYMGMAAYFESEGLEGFAHWMETQAQEEVIHAQKFYHYVNEVGGRVVFDGIAKPPAEYKSPLAVFQATLEHEKHVTSLINKLITLARGESDYATEAYLQWFITEQVEEEANASRFVAALKRIGDSPNGIFMMDREAGSRPAPSAASAAAAD